MTWIADTPAQNPTSVTTGSSNLVTNQPTRYMGLTVREIAGTPAAAAFRLRDGQGGTLIEDITLGGSESRSDRYGPNGVNIVNGVYFELVTGVVELTVFTI